MTDPSAPPGSGLVQVTRSGGFAGLTLRGEVDVDRLDEPDRAAWESALQVSLGGQAEEADRPGGADRFVYRVCRPATGLDVTLGEHELPDAVRALLDRTLLPPP